MEDAGATLLKSIFPGDGDMSRLMRETDWSATPLGAPATWPEGLKTALRMMLTSRFEMWLGWGPDLLFFCNDAYIPTLGIKHPTMLGKPFREVWAEVYADVEDQVASVAQGHSTWNEALLLLLERSGFPEETYHSFSYSPLYDDQGKVDGLLCIVSEETERIISERHLAMLRSLGSEVAGALDLEAIHQAVQNVLGAYRKDFPFALLQLGGTDSRSFAACSPDAVELESIAWPAADDTIDTFALPAGRAYPTGPWEKPPLEAMVVPIRGNAGESLTGSVILALNPYRGRSLRGDGDLKEVATLIASQIGGALAGVAALQTERRRADRIWTHSRDLMVVVGADGVFRSVSPSWTSILGHPVEAIVGRHFEHFMLAEDVAGSRRALDQAVGDSDLTGFENRFIAVDGTPRWISWHTAQEDGLVYAYGRDITEQKLSTQALAEAEQALRQAQKMEAVGQLTGGIAHDFNNLLTGIIGSLEVMERRAAQGRDVDIPRYVDVAKSCALRAAGLTQRLLAFSRRQSLDTRRVDVTELVEGMHDLLRRSIGETIALASISAPELWPIRCDANQLESALLNLAINARDAMPDGGKLTIEATNVVLTEENRPSGIAAGDYVRLSVTDTGTGMTAETLAKVFEPFFTTKPIGQGTGLGLSMIYGFVRQSGGHVALESAVGHGTKVVMFFPRDTQIEDEAPLSGEAGVDSAFGAGGNVLVVEDEPAVRGLVVEMLADLGFRAIEAVDGPSGLDVLKSETKIDLLVTDVGLPGLNGRQLADAGRIKRPDLKILFMTGYAHQAAVGNGLLEPGMELITKPFTIDHLATQVRTMLDI
ncbi:PAS domain-containing protein [Novosphingobium terrae]|uniref:PAS domain-containing protein n=1 Tax=Novosphingobium terrae TaxID=2726189 RepID=UPI001F1337F2|nr:PAS domain-containing protein [Novosphingobium terrae]